MDKKRCNRTKVLRQPLPIEKYDSQRVQFPLFHDNYTCPSYTPDRLVGLTFALLFFVGWFVIVGGFLIFGSYSKLLFAACITLPPFTFSSK